MASGIAEHHEARRREVRYLQKAWVQQKHIENGNQGRQGMTVAEMVAYGLPSTSNNSRQSSNTYQQQLRSMVMQQDQRNAEAIDRQLRQDHQQRASTEYSAKLPNRYNSIDYMAQW